MSTSAISLILMSALVAGCGFQLRGQAQLPPGLTVTYIKAQRPPGSRPDDLSSALERALIANGVIVTTTPQEATATLEILSEAIRRRTVAAGTRVAADFREYTLSYEVDYQVTLASGKKLVPQENVSSSRNLLYDESKVLGKAAGEEILIRAMVSDLARAIILRLQAAKQ